MYVNVHLTLAGKRDARPPVLTRRAYQQLTNFIAMHPRPISSANLLSTHHRVSSFHTSPAQSRPHPSLQGGPPQVNLEPHPRPSLPGGPPHIFLLEGLTCWEDISGRNLLEGYGWGNLVGDNFVGRNIDGRNSRNIAGRNLAGRNEDLAGRNLAGQSLLEVMLLGGSWPGRILLGGVLH